MYEKSFGNIPEFELMPALEMTSTAGIEEIIAQTPLGLNEKQAIQKLIVDFRINFDLLKRVSENLKKEEIAAKRAELFKKIEDDITLLISRFQSHFHRVHPNFIPRIMQVLHNEVRTPGNKT